MKKPNPANELYQRLRERTCEELWDEDVPRFDRATARERVAGVGVVRAVGVVFAASGNAEQKSRARDWLRQLLKDPEEKVRRYALSALPKLGAAADEEADVLALLPGARSEREIRIVGRTLEKIGGTATLQAAPGLPARTAQKAAANVARSVGHGRIRFDRVVGGRRDVSIVLHCRRGLESLLADEMREQNRFAVTGRGRGELTVQAAGDFRLSDLFTLRCFASMGFSLGKVQKAREDRMAEDLAALIASPAAAGLFRTLTEGPVRYRMEFLATGHRRGLVRRVGDAVYARRPDLLNDARHALWQVDIRRISEGWTVELAPRLRPDPRFAYRRGDVPAASHPPLAAAMARLAGRATAERVWDPFCGSGLELIERSLRGGVQEIVGTDLSDTALNVTRDNLREARLEKIPTTLFCGDFRNFATGEPARRGFTLIMTNPPMGRRVPIPNLEGLIADLFSVAAATLRPGGRLVLANPRNVSPTDQSLRRVLRQSVDLGGFSVFLEKYEKTR